MCRKTVCNELDTHQFSKEKPRGEIFQEKKKSAGKFSSYSKAVLSLRRSQKLIYQHDAIYDFNEV
jgi:hypothetical protein